MIAVPTDAESDVGDNRLAVSCADQVSDVEDDSCGGNEEISVVVDNDAWSELVSEISDVAEITEDHVGVMLLEIDATWSVVEVSIVVDDEIS